MCKVPRSQTTKGLSKVSRFRSIISSNEVLVVVSLANVVGVLNAEFGEEPMRSVLLLPELPGTGIGAEVIRLIKLFLTRWV